MPQAIDREEARTRCCVVGGGPAGMVLGFLLARAGVEVMVLEKHVDFLRDFRGDTIHPSTLELMHELGILAEFLKLPHQEVDQFYTQVGDSLMAVADLRHLPTRCKFIALMPQWDFLNFIAGQAQRYATFELRMQTEVTELLYRDDRVVGVRAHTPKGELEVSAELVVGTDGRHSTVRSRAGLHSLDLGAPMDVLWMRLGRRKSDPAQTMGRFDAGRILVLLDRQDYWQCAFVIHKGTMDEIRQNGLASLRQELAQLMPFLHDRVEELTDWNQINLLTVTVDRLERWYRPGLLCIGDAAHAMSPLGGVGINLAVQDAVAAANALAPRFSMGGVSTTDLAAIQKRRELPTRATQRLQVLIQNRVISNVLSSVRRPPVPLVLRLLRRWPLLRRIPAYLIGIGIRPEHVKTPAAGAIRTSAR